MKINTSNKSILLYCLLSLPLLTACTSNSVVGESTRDLFTKYDSSTEWISVVNDDVIAFGKPSTTIPNEPQDNVVIAGKQYSYVINKGGTAFFQLITQLNPQYIQVNQALNFITTKENNRHFRGQFQFSYAPPNGILSEKETLLFQQYGVQPCDCERETSKNKSQFAIDIEGNIYPIANNLGQLTPLSKPYRVKIEYSEYKSGKVALSTTEKLANLPLLPFSVAIDVIQLPFKALGVVYQP